MNKINNSDETMICYKSMISSGKTTVCIALAQYARSLRLLNPVKYENLTILYCCSLETVCTQVA